MKITWLLLFTIFLSSCSHHNTVREELETSAWKPTSISINVRGRYVPKYPRDKAGKATTVSLSSLKLKPGDYIGFRARGEWYAWKGDPNPHQGMGAVFMTKRSEMIHPGDFGQNQPFYFFDSPQGPFGITDKDFLIPATHEVIIRIPEGTSKIAFTVPDSIVGDNCPPVVTGSQGYICKSKGFKVEISRPNKKSIKRIRLIPSSIGAINVKNKLTSEINLQKLQTAPPIATNFSASPFSLKKSSAMKAQWRGSYNVWWPKYSHYKAKRPGGSIHNGWDIFAPKGSNLIAPVWPSLMTIHDSSSFGKSVVFSFEYDKKIRHISYSHLDGVVGNSRLITGPELVAKAGCSGGSVSNSGCGKPYANGTRNDHVHVASFTIGPKPNDAHATNPSKLLKWKIK